jgi:hypothetical protein
MARQRERRQHDAGDGRGQQQASSCGAEVTGAPQHTPGHGHRHPHAGGQFAVRHARRRSRRTTGAQGHGPPTQQRRGHGQCHAGPGRQRQLQQDPARGAEHRQCRGQARRPAPMARCMRIGHQVGDQRRLAHQRGQAHAAHALGRHFGQQQPGDRAGDHRHTRQQAAEGVAEAPRGLRRQQHHDRHQDDLGDQDGGDDGRTPGAGGKLASVGAAPGGPGARCRTGLNLRPPAAAAARHPPRPPPSTRP